jgi:hypothetical protein
MKIKIDKMEIFWQNLFLEIYCWRKIMNAMMTAALLFVPFVPKIIDYLESSQETPVAAKTVHLAQEITQCDSPEAALTRLLEEPHLKADFISSLTQFLLSYEDLRLKSLEAARTRDMILASLGSARRGDWMVILAAGGLIACVLSLTFFKEHLSGESVGIISAICGIFGSCLKDAFGFEFGSSRGSREKDILMTKSNFH